MKQQFYNPGLLLSLVLLVSVFHSCKEGTVVSDEMNEEDIQTEEVEPCPLGKYNGIVVSYQNTREEVLDLGASVIHSWFQWDFAEPILSQPFITEEEVTEEMIAAYASGERPGIDWTITDDHVNEYNGLQLIMGVGSGWINSLPLFNGEKITPDIIGRDKYLGQLYLHTRACVRRYKDQVLAWQIENEPNISEELINLGLREGEAWTDINFMTRVLTTLEKAVREEDPEAWITINFFVDFDDYEEDINRWISLVDMVGLDSYQDYFTDNPKTAADSVLSKVKHIAALTGDKPVMILETGYASGPEPEFTEENQEVFIRELYSGIEDYNGCGVLYFKHTTNEQSETPVFPFRFYRGLIRENGEEKEAWYTLKSFM